MKILSFMLAASVLVISSSANAALLERLGGLAYYDDVANLTWLSDANYASTQYINSGGDEGAANGRMNWLTANDWATSLTVGGTSGWRLANSDDCLGANCTGSEMGNLFYNVLGNTAGALSFTGPFSNVQSYGYWSGTRYIATGDMWAFEMTSGNQAKGLGAYALNAWAVQSGDVSPVPVPAALWLFGSGLIGLVGLARRKR